jgi:uncharacterized protein (DUF1501 family)
MRRRDFIKTLAVSSAGAALSLNSMPIKALSANSVLGKICNPSVETDKVLVVLQLLGGNDGLNTVIPYQDSMYYTRRPNLGIPAGQVLSLPNSTMGLHPAMTDIKNLFMDSKVALVQGVGYPNPNFSHFRATDIWHTASNSNEYFTTGWLGRYLKEEYPNYPNQLPPDPMAIQIGLSASLSLMSQAGDMSLTFQDPNQFYQLVQGENYNGYEKVKTLAGPELDFARRVAADSLQYATRVRDASNNGQNLATYPTNNSLADQLKIVARLIDGGLQTRLYVVTISGFDTHTQQLTPHNTLWSRVNAAINAFYSDLFLNGISGRVVGMTLSEFGRRVAENGSVGTDHGTAAPMFLFGDLVNGAIYGNNPDLVNLNNGNLIHQYDYRQVYASVLKQLFAASDQELLNILYQQFQTLPIIVPQKSNGPSPKHNSYSLSQNYPNPFNPSTEITYTIKRESNVSIKIYDTSGREIQTLVNERKPSGVYKVIFDATGRKNLASGVYFYKLTADDYTDVKKMILVK